MQLIELEERRNSYIENTKNRNVVCGIYEILHGLLPSVKGIGPTILGLSPIASINWFPGSEF